MLVEKFVYAPLTRINTDSGRMYQTPDGKKLPSITTVLSKTKDMAFLREWKARVGEEEAQRIVTQSTTVGTKLHKYVEDFIVEGRAPSGPPLVKMMFNVLIKNISPKMKEVWGCEVPLYCRELYAGTSDVVFVHDNEPAIGDFKNSRKLKKREWIEDYFLQGVAYALAHNEMYGTEIKKVVIMIVTQDCRYQEFIIQHSEFDVYVDKWLARLEEYYRRFG